MANIPLVSLNDGNRIPQLGFGVYKIPEAETVDAVLTALDAGYRHIDTAAFYENERGVGEAVRRSGLPRDEVFVTTKVWWTDNGYDSTLRSFDASLERLGFDTVDLFLIHWPAPKHDKYVETWRALERLQKLGATAVSFSTAPLAGINLRMPTTGNGLLDPLVSLLCYYRLIESVTRRKGFDPDKPANLLKITETM